MIVSLVWGLLAICVSLAIPYEEFLYFVKNVFWIGGWILIGTLTDTSGLAASLGVLLLVFVLGIRLKYEVGYPLIFGMLFLGALGGILIGGAI